MAVPLVIPRLATAIVAALLVLAACGDDGSTTGTDITTDDAPSELRVARFDFEESRLLAELYVQALGAAGVPIRVVETTGPREIMAPALEQNQADLIPEYLGTATEYFGFGEPAPGAATVADLRDRLLPRGLTALSPAPAQNTNAFVVLAESGFGPRISDLADVATPLRFGGPSECSDRPLCLVGLESRYGIRFAEFVPQPSLAITAEALRRDEIDVGLLFSTDATVTDDLLVLEDDKALQPSENIVPVIRIDALDRWGDELVSTALDAVSASLTTEDLRELNRLVSDGESTEAVAARWLTELGLVDSD